MRDLRHLQRPLLLVSVIGASPCEACMTGIPDYETDTIIQTSLRKELPKDVTLLVVAHRLQTIMDADKIVSFFLSSICFNDVHVSDCF